MSRFFEWLWPAGEGDWSIIIAAIITALVLCVVVLVAIIWVAEITDGWALIVAAPAAPPYLVWRYRRDTKRNPLCEEVR